MASRKQRKEKKKLTRMLREERKAQRRGKKASVNIPMPEVYLPPNITLPDSPDPIVDDIINAAEAVQKASENVLKAAETPKEVQVQVETQAPAAAVAATPSKLNLPFSRKIGAKVSRAKEFFFGSTKATDEEKELRKQYGRITQQAILTQELIRENNTLLQEKAKTDVDLADLLSVVANSKELKEIFDKTNSGQQLFGDELITATKFMERVTNKFEDLGLSLSIGLKRSIDQLSTFVKNEEVDITARRDAFEGIQNSIKSLKIKTEATDELLRIDSARLNFTEEQNREIDTTLQKINNEFAKGTIQDKKLTGTVRDLNKTFGAMVLTQRELSDFLETQTSKGTMKDRLQEGFGAVGGGIKRGLLSTGLAALGIPGLDLIVEDLLDLADLIPSKKQMGKIGGLFKKGGGALGRGARGMGGLLSKIPGLGRLGGGALAGAATIGGTLLPAAAEGTAAVASKGAGLLGKAGGLAKGAGGLLKGGARLLGKAALPLAAIMAAVDFAKGFSNAADIAGLKEGEEASFGTKMQAGLASVTEGLTFGLVDAKDAFGFINDGVEMVSSGLASAGEFIKSGAAKIAGMFDLDGIFTSISDGLASLFGEEGFLSKAKTLVQKIMEFMEYTPLGLLAKGAGALGNWLFGDSNMIPATVGVPSAVPSVADNRALNTATTQNSESRVNSKTTADNSGKTNTVVVPAPQGPSSRGPTKQTQIDDMGLAVLNSSMMDR